MNDQLRTGSLICLGKTTYAIFPMVTLDQYLDVQRGTLGQLFLLPNNQSLTRTSYISTLKKPFRNYTWSIAI